MSSNSAGLCLTCCNGDLIHSDRGPVYYRCLLSASDPQFPKYPRLPVLACRGYEPNDGETSLEETTE